VAQLRVTGDIYKLFSSRIRVALLKIFVLNPESSFNINNELSRRTKFSPRGVEKELKNFQAVGILKKEVVGNQHRYQLDLLCPIHQEIIGIITKTIGMANPLK
jgi:predicted transcriptional regulator